MSEVRKKIVVVGGQAADAAALERALGDRYEVVTAPVRALDDSWQAALLEAIGEAVCLARSSSGEVLWSNGLFQGLDAGTRERIAELCRVCGPALAGANPGAAAGQSQRSEIASPDLARYYEVSLTGAPDRRLLGKAAGPPSNSTSRAEPAEYLAVVVRDVTAARRGQQKLDAIDRAGAELMKMDADSIRRMNSVERLKNMEAKIVGHARDLLHFDHFGIRLLDERTGRLELVISSGLPPSYADIDIYPLPEGNGISGYVAATGRSYICEDAPLDPLFLPGLTGARSSLTVPLKLDEKVIGILNTESQRANAFTQEDRVYAEIFARSIAMALHILDLLVVERSSTNQSVSGRVEGELSGPLQDILQEVDVLYRTAPQDPETAKHIARIKEDVDSIRSRVKEVALGPTTLLGVERALADKTIDPLMSGKRVLVADDEPKIRRIIGDVLRNRGCEVTVCENGLAAIEAIGAAASGGKRFNLIVSDIKMPDRNGYEVFASARRVLGDVPVILMTGFGYDPHHSIVRASQEGLQTVLFKPFPVERLVDEVRKALSGAGPRGIGLPPDA